MATGIVAAENLITRVSLIGVQETERNQKLVGAGFRALKGDIAGARAEMQGLGVAGSMLTTGLGVGMMAASAGLGSQIVSTTIRIDSLRQGLVAMTGSEETAEKRLKRLKEVAKLPGLGFEEAIQGSIVLESTGLSAQTAEGALVGFSNALALVGRGKADLEGVNRALGQIMGKGKVSAEEINQIAERVPQIRQIMQDAFGTANTEELQKMGLSSQQFIEGVVAGLKKLPPAIGGLRNDVDNLGDAWNQFLYGTGSGTKGGLSGAINLATNTLTAFNNLNESTHGLAGTTLAVGVGLTFVTGAIIAVMPGIKALRDMWLEVAGAATTATAAQRTASTAGAGAGTTAAAGKGAGIIGKAGGLLKGLAIYEGIKFGAGLGVDRLQEKLQKNPSSANRAKFGFGIAGANIGAGTAGGWATAGPVGALVGAVIGVGSAFMDFNKRNKENQQFWSKSKTESQFTPGTATSTESPVIKYLKEIANNTKTTIGGGSRSVDAYNSGDVQRALYKALNAQVV